MNRTIQHYHLHAESLDAHYQSQPFERVHDSWQAFWPDGSANCQVLDIGAGSGRDAIWYAEHGCEVHAVEPARSFRDLGEGRTKQLPVTWLSDTLPELKTTNQLGIRFDYVVLSAVWMHIAPSERARSFRKLANLLAPNGRLVITLRHGEFSDGRTSHPVSIEEIEQLAKDHALNVRYKTELTEDVLGRDDVQWQTIVLSLPDDGSGDLVKIRHIIVNDNKAATYKLALLRTLLRIADAHPGAVIDRTDGKVALPLGLVGLYWIRQFKRLIDMDYLGSGGIQQNSNTSKGLGFVKADGWDKLKHLAPDDLAIGSIFTGEDAKSLQQTLRDTLATIKAGPVTFIYQGDKSRPLFKMERSKSKSQSSFIIDNEFLAGFGEFILEESLWDCLRLYSSWIEPLVVNQWIMEMKRFERNRERNIPLQIYYDSLVWIDADHDTKGVRKRIEKLRAEEKDIISVWSGKNLADKYHVDHCLPFAYWPNNDRWNLLPTTEKENLEKRDRLPNKQRLAKSKERILDFWQLAWESDSEKQSFFSEASLSLPNIPPQCHEFEAVFEAMGLQVSGVKSRLLVGEW